MCAGLEKHRLKLHPDEAFGSVFRFEGVRAAHPHPFLLRCTSSALVALLPIPSPPCLPAHPLRSLSPCPASALPASLPILYLLCVGYRSFKFPSGLSWRPSAVRGDAEPVPVICVYLRSVGWLPSNFDGSASTPNKRPCMSVRRCEGALCLRGCVSWSVHFRLFLRLLQPTLCHCAWQCGPQQDCSF